MAAQCCGNCAWLAKRGGVYVCGCRSCSLYNKSVDINASKSCPYHK